MDIASLINSFATGTYTVTRTTHRSPVRGRAVDGTQTTFTITASTHPATGNDLKKLPEGRRTNETRAVYTTTQLLIGGEGDAFEADSISIGGQDFEVEHVETWTDPLSSGVGYRCLVQAIR